ncbi:MAG: UvrD-helicase domain-containing protein [Phocaeicola sp.]
MEQIPELVVYKASAGAGKTFTLAVEYIKLLIENPRAYRNVLAVTFTNKATSEMKERILSQLYGIWTGDKASAPYLQKVVEQLGKSEEEIQKAAGEALRFMIHDYSRFRIETIDSFFQSVMRNLARELELGANLTIELNNSEVLSDAVDSMIEKLDRNSPLLYWLLEYIDERIADDKRWNVSNEIKSFGRSIFDEGYIERGAGLREKLQDKNCIKNYRRTLQAIQQEALEQMKGFSEQFVGVLEGYGLAPEDLKNGSRGIASYFNKLQQGELGDKIRNATVEKCLASAEEWSTKTSPNRPTILNLAEQQFIPLLNESEQLRSVNNLLINSCQLSLRHINNVRLLSHIDQEVRSLNEEQGRFLLSDTNALLHQLVKDDDSSFVFEKIGANIRHVMIDEFQDTSRMQWDNFRLLLLEGLSQGANSLIVGDVKQSIYRWRNGDWGILNGLKSHIDAFPIRVETLKTNRRSAANVILFNNSVFTKVCELLNERYRAELNSDCIDLQEAYSDVCQETDKDPGQGYVKATFLAESKKDNYTELTLAALAEEVVQLVQTGVVLSDMAILVRKNKNIPLIADYFDKNTPYKIVSDEAFRLDASLAICMLMDGLRYLTQPTNQVAKAQLAAAYQNEILKKEIEINQLLLTDINSYLPTAFLEQQEELCLMPLYEVLERMFHLFEMARIEQQDAYLCAFFDAVLEYQQRHSSELTAFIKAWEEKLCAKTIPSGEVEGIRILSIHKSKGLEYHTVLLPFCDWKMENETNSHMIWCAPQQPPFSDLDIVPVNYSGTMQQSIYQADYLNERLQLWVDSLNMLYVAFTRARKNLILWGRKEKASGTVSEILQQALNLISLPEESVPTTPISELFPPFHIIKRGETATEATDPSLPKNKKEEVEAEDILYEAGVCYPSEAKKEQQAHTNKLLIEPTALPLHVESIEAQVEFKQSNQSTKFVKGQEEKAEDSYIQQGELLHHLFEGIRTERDIPNAIERLTLEGLISSSKQRKEIEELIKKVFQSAQVRDWYSGRWELYNECAILYKENGKLQTRRPDRVMMKENEVVVVDLKFGKKRKNYNKQVAEYMTLLEQMGYTQVRGYLWYLFKNEVEEITR